MILRRPPRTAFAGFCLLMAVSCKRDEVRSYSVERQPETEADQPGPKGVVALPVVPPEGWQVEDAVSPRIASFSVPAGDGSPPATMSVVAFPGRAGGLLANANRWRGELGLEPIGAGELPEAVSQEQGEGYGFFLVDFTGAETSARRMLGAMLPLDAETWFFKLSGSSALVALEKERFLEYVRGVRVPAGSQSEPAELFAADAGQRKPTVSYELPVGWVEKEPSTMRVASFAIKREGLPDADVSVVPLGGTGGSDLDNIAQWRHQLGLEPMSDDETLGLIEAFEAGGRVFKIVDLASDQPLLEGHKARMLVAFLKDGERTWFFKLVGEAGIVGEEKEAFTSFLRSLQLPPPAG